MLSRLMNITNTKTYILPKNSLVSSSHGNKSKSSWMVVCFIECFLQGALLSMVKGSRKEGLSLVSVCMMHAPPACRVPAHPTWL